MFFVSRAPLSWQDGTTLVFRHDIFDYSHLAWFGTSQKPLYLFRLPLSGFEPAQNQHALQAAALDRCFFSALHQDITEKQINLLNVLTGVAPSRSSRRCRSIHTFRNLARGMTVFAFTMSLMWDVAGAVAMRGFDPKEASLSVCNGIQWLSFCEPDAELVDLKMWAM